MQDIPPKIALKQFLRQKFRISNFKPYVTTPLSAEFNFRSFELSNVKNRSAKDMFSRIQFLSPVWTSSACSIDAALGLWNGTKNWGMFHLTSRKGYIFSDRLTNFCFKLVKKNLLPSTVKMTSCGLHDVTEDYK